MLDGCSRYQEVDLQPGDILLVRTGWGAAFNALDIAEQSTRRNQGTGVARGEAVLKWHWEKGIAAVASDVYVKSPCGL